MSHLLCQHAASLRPLYLLDVSPVGRDERHQEEGQVAECIAYNETTDRGNSSTVATEGDELRVNEDLEGNVQIDGQ